MSRPSSPGLGVFVKVSAASVAVMAIFGAMEDGCFQNSTGGSYSDVGGSGAGGGGGFCAVFGCTGGAGGAGGSMPKPDGGGTGATGGTGGA